MGETEERLLHAEISRLREITELKLDDIKDDISDLKDTVKANRLKTEHEISGLKKSIESHYLTEEQVEIKIDQKINKKLSWFGGIILGIIAIIEVAVNAFKH